MVKCGDKAFYFLHSTSTMSSQDLLESESLYL